MLATTQDLRAYTSRHGDGFRPYAIECRGRSEVTRAHPHGPLVDNVMLWDQAGWFSDSGVIPTPPVLPEGGWFRYALPIRTQTQPREFHDARGTLELWFGSYNLRDSAEDLCVNLWGWDMLRGSWQTNTVTVPHAMIRAAMDAP